MYQKAMQRGLGGFPHERLHQDTGTSLFLTSTIFSHASTGLRFDQCYRFLLAAM